MVAAASAPTSASEIRAIRPVRRDEAAPDGALDDLAAGVFVACRDLSDAERAALPGVARDLAALVGREDGRSPFGGEDACREAAAMYGFVLGLRAGRELAAPPVEVVA